MPWGLAAAAVGTVAGAAIQGNAAKSAANTQANAAATANAEQTAAQQPWTTAGGAAVTQLGTETQPGGQFNKPFTMADATNSSAETTALTAGKQAIDNSAAAKGGLLSTNDIQDNTTFAENTAASFQNQAFNQNIQQNQQQLNAQQSLAGLGQSSASDVGDNSANLTLAAGNAQAAGTVGSTNATVGGINGVASSLGSQIGTISKLFGGGTSSVGIGTTDPNAVGIGANNTSGDLTSVAGDYSDKRMKSHLRLVGSTKKGLPIYTYTMKGGSGKRQMGVLAQDVERDNPEAVSHDSDGMKLVDYAKVA